MHWIKATIPSVTQREVVSSNTAAAEDSFHIQCPGRLYQGQFRMWDLGIELFQQAVPHYFECISTHCACRSFAYPHPSAKNVIESVPRTSSGRPDVASAEASEMEWVWTPECRAEGWGACFVLPSMPTTRSKLYPSCKGPD